MSGFALSGCNLVDDDPPPGPPEVDLTNAAVHHYRITSIDLPMTNEEAIGFAFDLDPGTTGDTAVDNQLGAVYVAVRQVDSYYAVEEPAAARLQDDVPWVLTIYDAGSRGAGVRIARGVIIDGVAVPIDEGEPAIGVGLAPSVVLEGGDTEFPLGAISDGLGVADPGWVPTWLTHVSVDAFTPTRAAVRLGIAVAKSDIDTIVAENLAAFFNDALANGLSEFARDYLDANQDGVITAAEVRTNELVEALLEPDLISVDLPTPALSLGVRLTAVAQ